MNENVILKAKVYGAEVTEEIQAIAEKIGIVLPSSHTAIFRTVYARIEEANGNGVRLSRKAVLDALPGLVGSQVNLEHLGKGFMVGIILDASLNDKDEIETVFTFAKNIYDEDYERALAKMQTGELSVSFELLADRDGQEFLQDGTVRLHDIDFQGQGLLIDETPAYKKAIVFDMAKQIKQRALNEQKSGELQEREMLFASQVVASCDNVLSQEVEDAVNEMPEIFIVTTSDDQHFHVAVVDFDGNGQTISGHGEGKHEQPHKITNWQVQEAESSISDEPHAHGILAEVMAKVEEYIKSKDISKTKSKKAKGKDDSQTKQGGNNQMTEEQKKLVADLRAELGDFAKDVSDEELLDEAKVEELKQAKTEAEAENTEDESTDAEKAEARIAELEAENAELKATIEAKDSEIESVRENAEKIGKLKVELKDNAYVAEFSDEDYLDEGKVEQAKMKAENDRLKAENEELAKKAKEAKEKVEASEESNEDNDDLETGHDEDNKTVSVSAMIRKLK